MPERRRRRRPRPPASREEGETTTADASRGRPRSKCRGRVKSVRPAFGNGVQPSSSRFPNLPTRRKSRSSSRKPRRSPEVAERQSRRTEKNASFSRLRKPIRQRVRVRFRAGPVERPTSQHRRANGVRKSPGSVPVARDGQRPVPEEPGSRDRHAPGGRRAVPEDRVRLRQTGESRPRSSPLTETPTPRSVSRTRKIQFNVR